jgi:hypothetical protein
MNCTVKANLEQNFVPGLKQIKLSPNVCFIPLPTALFHGAIGAFRAQNIKSNNMYLLMTVYC